MNIQITIGTTPALEKALLGLTSLLSTAQMVGDLVSAQEGQPLQQAPISQEAPMPVQQMPIQQQPLVQSVPLQQAPVQQNPAPQTVPTTAATYSMDQLAVAATQLMDAGKRNELLQLIASFGVQALTALPLEQYGTFATKLRELGANI